MSKNNSIKHFIRIQSNFETTNFLSNKYLSIFDKYYNIKYYDDIDDKESQELEYELKHYNKLLCSSIYNDYRAISLISDKNGMQYKIKKGFKTDYNKLNNMMNKKIYFEDGSITLLDFLERNRVKLNHSDNPTDEKHYIDYYNMIISYKIYDYTYDILEMINKIINKIGNDIGQDKIEKIINNEKSNEIVLHNYFKVFKKIVREILKNIRKTEIQEDDMIIIKRKINVILKDEFSKSLLINNQESINYLRSIIEYLNIVIKKYEELSKGISSNKSNEKRLLNAIFYNNYDIVVNLLVELSEVLTKLLKDINKPREKMLQNLLVKKEEYISTIIKK